MSAMERTTYRRSRGSNALAFDEPRRDPQHAPYTSGPSTDFSLDDSIPLFLSDLQGQPDPRELAPLAASQRTSILTRVVAGGLVVSAFAILVAVFNSDVTRALVSNSDVTRFLIDKARAPIGGATKDQSAIEPRISQRRRPPRTSRLCAKYCWKIRPRAIEHHQCCRVRPRPHVQGMKPLRRRKRSMPKRWQR